VRIEQLSTGLQDLFGVYAEGFVVVDFSVGLILYDGVTCDLILSSPVHDLLLRSILVVSEPTSNTSFCSMG